MDRVLSELSAEISGISMVIAGLANQLDKDTVLNHNSMERALFAISCHLERIVKDMDIIETEMQQRKGA